jgi:phosphoglycolate phosphatase-like HAD superfamily hydrolase
MKIAIDLDHVLGDTRPLWRAWLADASRRYRSIAPLDTERLPDDRAEAAQELDRWASAGIGDWRAALERFAEENGPVHLRPDSEAAAALRRLRARGARRGVFTDAPEPLARVALAHLGAARRLDEVEAGADALERLLERMGREAVVVRSQRELADLAL